MERREEGKTGNRNARLIKLIEKEVPEEIEKNNLKDWFLEKQKNREVICDTLTVTQLYDAAESCGIKLLKNTKKKVKKEILVKEVEENIEAKHFKFRSKKDEVALNKKKLKEMYVDKKMSSTQIANIYGVTAATIRTYLKKHNIPIRHLDRADKRVSKQQLQETCAKCTREEAAKKLGISIATLYKLRRIYKLN